MPFRSRMKRVFGHSSSGSSSSASAEKAHEPTLDYRKDSTVYRPGEFMPRPKYRQPAEREHKARLESFSFGAAAGKFIRRLSNSSNYSPMGTRLPSRSTSVKSKKANSRNMSRNASFQGESKFGGTVEKLAEDHDEINDVANGELK